MSAGRSGSFASVIDGNHPQTNPNPMKKLVLFIVVLVSFSACKKGQDEVKPKGTASEIIGTYELTNFRLQLANDKNDYQYPQLPVVQKGKKTDYGTVTLREVENNLDGAVMGLSLTLPTIGLELDEEEFAHIDVKKNGSKYDIYADGTKFASVSGSTLSLDVKTDDFHMAFTAKR